MNAKRRVLVIDDDPECALRLKIALTLVYDCVVTCISGIHAILADGTIVPETELMPASTHKHVYTDVTPFSIAGFDLGLFDFNTNTNFEPASPQFQDLCHTHGLRVWGISGQKENNQALGSPRPEYVKNDTVHGLEDGTLTLDRMLAEASSFQAREAIPC